MKVTEFTEICLKLVFEYLVVAFGLRYVLCAESVLRGRIPIHGHCLHFREPHGRWLRSDSSLERQ